MDMTPKEYQDYVAKKAKKSAMTRVFIVSACVAMLAIHFFSWNISAISLMLMAAVVSLVVFFVGDCRKRGGEGR